MWSSYVQTYCPGIAKSPRALLDEEVYVVRRGVREETCSECLETMWVRGWQI